MSAILNEYGGLLLAILAVLAMFIVYGAILDKGRLQFVYYNASPFSEYNVSLDAEEVHLGQYEYGAIADDIYSVFNIGRSGNAKAPWFHVKDGSITTIPLQDESVDVYKPANESAARDLVQKLFIDDYKIELAVKRTDYRPVTLENILLVEYRPELWKAYTPDEVEYTAGIKYQWGYCLDAYGNRIRSEEDGEVRVYGDVIEDDNDFDLEVVVDDSGYLLIPVTKYARYLYVDRVDYTGKGGDSDVAASRDIYADIKEFGEFEYAQDEAVRYKVIYRANIEGMKAQHIALFRNTVRLPSMVYPDT